MGRSKYVVPVRLRHVLTKRPCYAQAMAWCPWKTDLLATAGTYPDGTIHIWSSASLSAASSPAPLHTLELDASTYSLHWSQHCKELLSTHGLSWQNPSG